CNRSRTPLASAPRKGRGPFSKSSRPSSGLIRPPARIFSPMRCKSLSTVFSNNSIPVVGVLICRTFIQQKYCIFRVYSNSSMSIKFRLTVMNFLEFFVWGAWLISLGGYMFNALHFTGTQIGSIYGTMGIASIFTPALFGIVADRWVNAERVLGICHFVGAASLLWASTLHDFDTFYLAMLLNSAFFMPTIALNNTVSYIILEKRNFNIVKDFPPIRVWGTVGFVCAMWGVDLSRSGLTPA